MNPSRKRRVLIVDDQSGFTRVIKLTLEKTGDYEVLEKNTSAGVVATAAEFDPDLILLDVIMPGSDGGDVVALLKEDRRTRDIPVIFLTATVRKQEIDARAALSAATRSCRNRCRRKSSSPPSRSTPAPSEAAG